MGEIRIVSALAVSLSARSSDAQLDRDILSVCTGVASVFDEMFLAAPPTGLLPVFLFQSPDGLPRALTNGLPGEYKVGVTCRHQPYFEQMAWQFGHELGHIYTGTLLTAPHWFVESICTALSLLCLSELARKWDSRGAPDGWSHRSLQYATYRARAIRDSLARAGVSSTAAAGTWIIHHLTDASSRSAVNRGQQMVCAVEMEKILQDIRGSIPALAHLGAAQDGSGHVSFARWQTRVRHHGDLLDALECRFGMALC